MDSNILSGIIGVGGTVLGTFIGSYLQRRSDKELANLHKRDKIVGIRNDIALKQTETYQSLIAYAVTCFKFRSIVMTKKGWEAVNHASANYIFETKEYKTNRITLTNALAASKIYLSDPHKKVIDERIQNIANIDLDKVKQLFELTEEEYLGGVKLQQQMSIVEATSKTYDCADIINALNAEIEK